MTVLQLLPIALSVLLSAASQILLKAGMVSDGVSRAIAGGDPSAIVISVATTPSVVLGFVSFGCSTLLWLWVLARTPLSTAYPFVSLGIAITAVAGVLLFGEQLSVQKIVGVTLIVIGILAVASA